MGNTQRRRTRKEMFPIVESWQHSRLSKKAFCEEQSIVKSAFFYWCKKSMEENEHGGFVPLSLGTSQALAQGHSIKTHSPNGVVLKLPANTPANLMSHYLGQ